MQEALIQQLNEYNRMPFLVTSKYCGLTFFISSMILAPVTHPDTSTFLFEYGGNGFGR